MGKRKHKKKKEKVIEKKRETLDIVEMERKEEIQLEEADKDQRRITRLGAIIAIIAIVGTLCTFLFKMSINILNVWSEHGVIYWYMQILFLLTLSTAVLVFWDIVVYVIYDFNRYNIVNRNYKIYDCESDHYYNELLSDFKSYTIMLFIVYSFIIPMSAIYEESKRWWVISVCVIGVVAGIIILKSWIKSRSKEEIKKCVIRIGGKLWKWILVGLGCYIIVTSFVVNNDAVIEVNFYSNGIVEICNTSAENYSGLDIEIYDKDDELIYKKDVKKGEVLFAKEDKYVNNEVEGKNVAEGIVIKSELLHWKYIFDLNEITNEVGTYSISIISHQDGKRVALMNSYFVKEKEYIFAKDVMIKEY